MISNKVWKSSKICILKSVKKLLLFFGFRIARVDRKTSSRFPIEIAESDRKLIQNASNYSMTGTLRMWALLNAIRYVIRNNIPGDIVECGVWRGGNLILAAQVLDEANDLRKIWGYDTFSGMTEPTIFDTYPDGTHVGLDLLNSRKDEKLQNIHAFASFESVEGALRKNLVDRRVQLVKGPVEETLLNKQNLPDSICILRLDTDWYESTKVELETLFPKLEKGGVLIIDDYGHFSGAKKAVDEYFGSRKVWMHYIDYTCRLMINI